ncbi:protein containing Thiamine pyrophosphate enzyme, partial [mine drainage metagenome]
MCGDCRLVTEELIRALEEHGIGPVDVQPDAGGVSARTPHSAIELSEWMTTIHDWQSRYPLIYADAQEGELLKPQMVIETLRQLTPEDTILVTGVGQHQMWASLFWQFKLPNTFVTSGGLGTMGFAVPAAIGAKVGRPDRMVWAIDGD